MCDSVMDTISPEPSQDLDQEAIQVTTDCLSNPEVVRKIFQNLSSPELLKLSYVNKLWNFEARIMMRKRKTVMAYIPSNYSQPFEQDFEAFGVHLRQTNVVPYSGIIMVIHATETTGRTRALGLTYEAILARLPLKHLSVRLLGKKWWKNKDCPALEVVKKLLQDFSGVLEQLTLDVEEKRAKFFKHFVRDCSFPGLKVLKLQDTFDTTDEFYARYIKALASRAPNLQEFHTLGPINLMVNALKESYAVLVHHQEVYAPFDEISETIIDTLRLENLVLEYTGPEFNLERCQIITPMLLKASSSTLRSIHIDAVFAVTLMCYGICLEKIDHLNMVVHNSQLELDGPRILSIVKHFNFTHVFPNLNKVEIICHFAPQFSPEHLNAVIEQAEAVLGEPMPNRAAHVKELYIDSVDFSDTTAPFFAEMFPKIEKLEAVAVSAEQEIPFGSIWKHWVDLKELEVTGRMIRNTGNLDSVFCGIFPEEVAELRHKDAEYLKRVHIVPVMPAITCLKNLTTLTLCRSKRSTEPYVDDGTFMFSKVTQLVAFKKFPSLAVSLTFRSHAVIPETNHLKDFASVTVI